MFIVIKKLWRIFPIKQNSITQQLFYSQFFLCWRKLNIVFANEQHSKSIVGCAQWTQIPRIGSDNFKLNISKSCLGITFLFNWKNSPEFSNAHQHWTRPQEFFMYSNVALALCALTYEGLTAEPLIAEWMTAELLISRDLIAEWLIAEGLTAEALITLRSVLLVIIPVCHLRWKFYIFIYITRIFEKIWFVLSNFSLLTYWNNSEKNVKMALLFSASKKML